jgi:L,D-transpeptidase catalytic domain
MCARDLLHGLSWVGALLVVAPALTGSAPAAIPAPPGGSEASSAPIVRLSDERAVTRWASPIEEALIRERPKSRASPITPLRLLTEDGFPEVYVLLSGWTDPEGRAWVQVRIPMRPNGQTGWVEASALGPSQLVGTQLIVNRRRLEATLYRSKRRIWRSPIAIGKRKTPTPAGRFWIRERIVSPNPRGPYGPLAFGTSAYSRLSEWPGSGVIGIHGTNEPDLIPGRPSHGCIRVPNRAIRRLADLMPIGTPVWIR